MVANLDAELYECGEILELKLLAYETRSAVVLSHRFDRCESFLVREALHFANHGCSI